MQMLLVKVGVLFLVLMGSLLAAGTKAVGTDLSPSAEKLYIDQCAICHGDNGDAVTRVQSGLRPRPRDFTTVSAALELTRERMIKSVAEGRSGTGMMAHQDRLTPAQVEYVVDYIRTKFMRTPDAQSVAVKNVKGEKLYTKHCSVCHGDKGNTAFWAMSGLNPPPRNFTDPEVRKTLTRERMLKSVTEGRPGTGMMPFTSRLSGDDIAAVVDYIRQAFMQGETGRTLVSLQSRQAPEDARHSMVTTPAARPATKHPPVENNPHQGGPYRGAMPRPSGPLPLVAAANMSSPYPNGLKGNVERGRAFFMGNCFTCHGVSGNGEGPRAYFIRPRPRDFTGAVSRRMFNRVRLFNGISKGRLGTVMPAWNKVLSQQQIADVAEYIFKTYIRPDDHSVSAVSKTQAKAVQDKKKP